MKNGLSQSLALLLFFSCATFSFANNEQAPASLAPMLQRILPSIVNINSQVHITDINKLRELQKQRGEKSLDKNNQFTSMGSGVVIDAKNGYILTNAHVVDDASSVTVTLGDGHHYKATIIGSDLPSDVAVLQIKAKKLTEIRIANSNSIKVGDFVAAIGNPFGLNQTVTSGIVSALGRTTLGIENFENFIQTDAPINPGNSGGALVNVSGELIGINTAILAPDRGNIGIGFAIPANMAKSVMVQLLKYGNVKRGMLGIAMQSITPELESAFKIDMAKGALITQVLPYSPAQKVGLKPGDIIVKLNGQNIGNENDVINTVGFLRVNSKIVLQILRQQKIMTFNIDLTDSKTRDALMEKSDPFLNGVGLKSYNAFNPIHGDIDGVLVTSVTTDSNAWHADLKTGDIITSINQTPVKTIADLRTLSDASHKELLLNIVRGNRGMFLVINKTY